MNQSAGIAPLVVKDSYGYERYSLVPPLLATPVDEWLVGKGVRKSANEGMNEVHTLAIADCILE